MMNRKRSLVLGMALAAGAIAIVSHPFDNAITARAQSCEYRVSPVRVDGNGAAMSGTVTVDTEDGCAWTAAAFEPWIWGSGGTPSWLQLSSTGGTGSGTIAYTVSPLAPGGQFPIRQARIEVRWNTPTLGQNVIVTQVTGPCTVSFLAGSLVFGPKPTSSHVDTFAEPPFTGPWYVASAPDWITFTHPPLGIVGRGDSATLFAVSENPSTSPREGVIRTCSNSIHVRQVGRSPRGGPIVPADFDDDGIADLAVLRTALADGIRRLHWFVLLSTSAYSRGDARSYVQSGHAQVILGQQPLAGDFDGDGKSDFSTDGVVRLSSVSNFSTGVLSLFADPRGDDYTYLAADFTGDDRTDFVSYRRATGQWSVRGAGVGPGVTLPQWGGSNGDQPVPGDYDGDGRADVAVWRPLDGTWYILASRFGYAYSSWQSIQWGLPGDIPVPGDYDNDGRTDPAIWRPSEGTWYFLKSSRSYARGPGDFRRWQWGEAGDVPVPNDYDGDGQTDLAVWRPSTGVWYLLFSRSNYSHAQYRAVQWGVQGDIPLK